MPGSRVKVSSAQQAISILTDGLKKAARRPNINGYRPHEKQIEFHSSQAQIRGFFGGNRSGKTVAGGCESVYYLLGRHPYRNVPEPPIYGRVVGSDFLNHVDKILRPEIARWMPLSEIKGGSWETAYNRETRVLELDNGSTLEFMSTEQHLDKHAGASRHFVWFDEEQPYDYYVENKMRLVDTGGDLWMTLTPLEGMSGWIYDDIYLESQTSDIIDVVVVEQLDNPYISESEAQALLAGLSKDDIEARSKGKFVQIGGLIYKDFDQYNIIDPIIPPQHWLHVASLDHGFNNPTAWLWGAVDKDGRVIVYDEHYESGKVVSYHAEKVHEKNKEHVEQSKQNVMPAYYVGDPSIRNTDPITGTSVQLEYIEFGVPVVLGNNDVRAGLNRVARYLKDHEGNRKLYITRNCVNLIHELQRYRWATWVNKKVDRDKNKKEEPHKKEDHAADSLRYLIMSRPEHYDDGTYIPENTYNLPTPVMDVNDVRDPGVLTPSEGPVYVDSTLGSEW